MIELGGTTCRLKILSSDKSILKESKVITTSPTETLNKLIHEIKSVIESQNKSIINISVSSFGPIVCNPSDPEWGKITNTSPKQEWRGFQVIDYLSTQLQLSKDNFKFDLDVNSSA